MTRAIRDRRRREVVDHAKRMRALDRSELRLSSEARQQAAGPMSFPVKRMDPVTRALIDAAIAERRAKEQTQ